MAPPDLPPQPSAAADPIEYLFSLERLGIKFGLESVSALCRHLGDPQTAFHSVIVAGTNGKGSVTAMVERGLRAAGHRTARYTSPHLVRIEERFVVDGCEVTTSELRAAAREVQLAALDLIERRTLDAPPTFFEFATAAAFVLFRRHGVHIAVLEVGLGGRLDATNIVRPVAAAITSIDFDHQAQLGDSIAAIAREKAGVVKPGIPVVCGRVPPEAERVIREVCDSRGAELIVAPAELPGVFAGVPLALKGAHQRANGSVAVALLEQLDRLGFAVDAAAMRAAISDVEWPGRLESFTHRGAQVLLDAAHNPAGAESLAAYLRECGWSDAILLFGAMRDKDAAAMLGALAPEVRCIICTTAPGDRAATGPELAAIARRLAPAISVEAVEDPAAALDRACALGARVVAAGSIFLIGPLRGILRTL